RRGFLPDGKDDDDERLMLEQRLSRDFRTMSAGIRDGRDEEAELYFLQQHYRMRTRLLDWTNNPLAALHFAVSNHEKNGMFFSMDAYQLGPAQNAAYNGAAFVGKVYEGKPFEGIADARNPLFQEALHVIFWFGKRVEEFPDFIVPVRPDYFDRRITLQRGCFTFHVPKRRILTTNENPTLKCYIVPKDKKPEIARELAILGIDDFSIFGDLEHLSTSLKAAYRIKDS